MMKNLLRSSPSTMSLLPRETSSVLKRLTICDSTASETRENSGTLRSASAGIAAWPSVSATSIRAALPSSTLVRLTRYVPLGTSTQGSKLSDHRGVIDIILGFVLVVFAKLRATPVVTLRCSVLSDMDRLVAWSNKKGD